jgi:selenocysteine lyase/cysteine desulfurase
MYRLMQYGTGNLSLLIGLGVAVEFHNQIGSARIQQRDFALADRLRTGLASVPGATIVSPTHPELTCATTVYGLKGKTGGQIQDYLGSAGGCASGAWETPSASGTPATSYTRLAEVTRRWRCSRFRGGAGQGQAGAAGRW